MTTPITCNHASRQGALCILDPGHKPLHRDAAGNRWVEWVDVRVARRVSTLKSLLSHYRGVAL